MLEAAGFAQSKRAMSYALYKHLNLDPNTISNTIIEDSDISSLFSHIANSSQDENKAPEDKANPTSAKNNKPSGDKKKVQDKSAGKTKEGAAEKAPEKTTEKDSECNVSILNIQVGLIHKAWKHPSADSLMVEEIDLGDDNVRQVVSGLAKYCSPNELFPSGGGDRFGRRQCSSSCYGLAKYCSPNELVNRHVVLITNVKPGKLWDVMSAGLVLCASNKDLTVVEPLIPPEGAKLGEHISFSGFDGKLEDVLNPKKKQLEKITLDLRTDENGIATFRGIPFTTSAGPCRSSISNADIK